MYEDNDDVAMMQRYGIHCEQKTIYHYKHYHYDKLEDAVNFAKLEHERADLNQQSKQVQNTSLKQSQDNE